jgi:tetrahydromethanopterin S-methyltransferase subunit A
MKTVKGSYHQLKDWVMDPKGYFLIRINSRLKRLEAGYCPKLPRKGRHGVKVMITGRTPQEIYFTAAKRGLISRLDHAAYLGKELEKAYVAMQLGLKYVQDDELIKANSAKSGSAGRKTIGKNGKK